MRMKLTFLTYFSSVSIELSNAWPDFMIESHSIRAKMCQMSPNANETDSKFSHNFQLIMLS